MPTVLSIPIGPVEAFVLIATRVLAVLMTSPIISMRSIPAQARLGLGLFTALILVPVLAKDGVPAGVDVNWTTLAGEVLVGALSGFSVTLAYTAIAFGASLLDFQSGFSMASLYDPSFGGQGAIIERFYNALAALLFFQTDAHHLLIQGLVQMFAVVPLGTFGLSRINPELIAQLAAATFVVALELVFPVMVALLLADIALGVLSRVAPQFGIFSIGMQVKILLALGALALTMPLLVPRMHGMFAAMVGMSVAVLR